MTTTTQAFDDNTHNAHLLTLAEAVVNTVDECETSWSESERKYHIPLHESIHRNADTPAQAELLNILLSAAWNDTILWAQKVRREIGGRQR